MMMIPPKWLAAGALLFSFSAIGAYATYRFYAPRLDRAKQEIGLLNNLIESQNRTVDEMVKAGEKRAREARQAIEAAKQEASKLNTKAQQVLMVEKPSDVDECRAASDLIRAELAK